MPSDDYAPTARGGLKLKGSNSGKPSGVEKKKKKKKKPQDTLQKALEDEEASAKNADADEEELDEAKLRELEERGGDGKTASERAQEEMRRRRVCFALCLAVFFLVLCFCFVCYGLREEELMRSLVARSAGERGRKDAQTARGGAE
jgi:protein FAM32A